MTNPDQIKTLALLSQRGFTVLSGQESLDFYVSEIGWNMRSLMRQADMLETAVLEMEKLLHEEDVTDVGAGPPNRDQNVAFGPGSSTTGLNKVTASLDSVDMREKVTRTSRY